MNAAPAARAVEASTPTVTAPSASAAIAAIAPSQRASAGVQPATCSPSLAIIEGTLAGGKARGDGQARQASEQMLRIARDVVAAPARGGRRSEPGQDAAEPDQLAVEAWVEGAVQCKMKERHGRLRWRLRVAHVKPWSRCAGVDHSGT